MIFLNKQLGIYALLTGLAVGLSACGGDDGQNVSSNDTHPEFSWAKVSTSNNYEPSGDITDIAPTFKWAAVLNASDYQFGHEDVNGATRWHDYELNTQQLSCTTNTCSYTPTDITFAIGDQKVWWVRAKVSGTWSSWSNSHVFKVIDNTSVPSLGAKPISPKGEIDTRFPTFKWTSDSNATLYQIGYENQNGTEWNQESVTPSQAYCQSLSCFYRPSNANFNIGDKKTWWVRSRINNKWGMWSAGANFSIKNSVIPPSNKAFKIRVDTRKTNLSVTPINQFLISTKGSGYNYSVDCNSDGVFEGTALTSNYLCRYPVAGEYTISIVGSFPQIYFDAPASGIPTHKTDARKITEIVQWGDQKWRSMENAFAGAENMTITASDKPDLSQVKNMYRMFWMASKLDQYIGDWDVSGVTNMSDMFGLAKIFNQDITGWDVRNVTDMAYMFDEAEMFNQDISVWNMSNVTNTSEMFWGAKAFNQAIGKWDLGKVENMYNMFYNAESFDQDVSDWDVTKVKPSVTRYYGMEGMFQGANLSSANYDKLLISWSNQNVQRNIILSAPSVKYSAAAVAARNKLVNNFGWTIRDAGNADNGAYVPFASMPDVTNIVKGSNDKWFALSSSKKEIFEDDGSSNIKTILSTTSDYGVWGLSTAIEGKLFFSAPFGLISMDLETYTTKTEYASARVEVLNAEMKDFILFRTAVVKMVRRSPVYFYTIRKIQKSGITKVVDLGNNKDNFTIESVDKINNEINVISHNLYKKVTSKIGAGLEDR